ncbi:MAG: pyridoxal-phosphate dependent enzyme, partial [Anaerolineae bacterium]
MPRSLSPPSLDAIRAAQVRTADCAVRTPLVRFNVEKPVPADIWLKLENLQPVGSFKLRGAGNAMRLAGSDALERGVWTASAGNMGRAVAWYARQLGVHCTVVVPDDAPAAKVDAIVRLGARIVPLPFARYQEIQRERDYPGADGLLIHPFADQAVMAGNGTIGLEILEDAPDVAAVLVPYGGGGLSCGIAAALHASGSPARVFGCEVASGAPLAASLAAGRPVETDYAPSFVTGIGAPFVFPEMWAL